MFHSKKNENESGIVNMGHMHSNRHFKRILQKGLSEKSAAVELKAGSASGVISLCEMEKDPKRASFGKAD